MDEGLTVQTNGENGRTTGSETKARDGNRCNRIKLEGLGGTWGSGWVRDRKEVGGSWREDLKVGGGGVERDGDKRDERVRKMKEAVCVVLVP